MLVHSLFVLPTDIILVPSNHAAINKLIELYEILAAVYVVEADRLMKNSKQWGVLADRIAALNKRLTNTTNTLNGARAVDSTIVIASLSRASSAFESLSNRVKEMVNLLEEEILVV